MTVEEYILKNCQHLPMAVHLDIAAAFKAGQRDIALKVDLANKNEVGIPDSLSVDSFIERS